MFIKISEFHGMGVIGPALWIAGVGLLLAAGSIFVFLHSRRQTPEERAAEFERLKRAGIFGILMIGAGLAASAFLGTRDLLTERYVFQAPGQGEIGRIFYQPLTETRPIPLKELIRKTGFKIVKDQLLMHRYGFIETPFAFFGEGEYFLDFEASGTVEDKIRSRIAAGVLTLEKNGTSLQGEAVVYELTPEAKKYTIPLRAAPGRIGCVRIEFLNSVTTTKNLTRVVTISNVLIRREGAK